MPLLEKAIKGDYRTSNEETTALETRQSISTNCKSRTQLTSQRDMPNTQLEIRSPFTQTHARTPWTLNYDCIFAQSTVQGLDDQLSPFQSTKEAFEDWLGSAMPAELALYANQLGPASLIFRIVHQDTLNLLQLMRLALVEIDRGSNDNILQERVLHWRYRLDQFRGQLVELEGSLLQFVEFVNPQATSKNRHDQPNLETDPIQYLLSDALGRISLLKQRIGEVYITLTSKVQIRDSHRSIAEAETVTRLTELAFLFIPLSFATSVFGMQIIDGSTPPSIYIGLAVGLTSLVYILRFLIHRTTDRRLKTARTIRNNITADARMRTGSRISTAIIFEWIYHVSKRSVLQYWRLTVLGAAVLIMVIVPLSILWTRDFNRGLQVTISCLLLSVPVLLVSVYVIARWVQGKKVAHLASPSTTPWTASLGES